ncbi:TPA: hypothetical protein O5T86_001292 [Staphylococcus aureus]|nr:hypothetical protein [Staphylococcus aureus]HDA7217747.1 hypothetical protein [Staphylococcus aureus]HDA7236829.1 hypothetical protein [Staphylococcus aureus]HDA7239255.1 hypothetical protein [Staphylococcus aureus]HDA7241866.1 hypothetical protein [Staphylococcus aureus]
MDQMFLDEAEKYTPLGPHYFAARKTAETFMADFQNEHFQPLAKKFAEEMYDKVRERLEEFLLSDTESNLHSFMWHHIDESVKALLSNQEWAIKRYALGERYDHGKIRETLAALIPAELQDARLRDLMEENERLRKDNEWLRQR